MNEPSTQIQHFSDMDHLKSLIEQKVNFIRITAIALFYLIHLWHVSSPALGENATAIFGINESEPVAANAHIAISILCFGWLMQAFGVHFLTAQKPVTDALIIFLTLGDLIWLTAILCVSTGAAGPVVIGYFLIIVLAGMRFDLRLIQVSTIGAIAGYLFVLAAAKWPVGWLKDFDISSVPRYHQLMLIVALILCGCIVGQIVRHAYVMSSTMIQVREHTRSTPS